MSPHEAFLAAIITNPDDDAPRLMYADWLTEHGDPRGEFIRIQVALAAVPEDEPPLELMAREHALLVRHRHEWESPLRALGCTGEVRFHRGFADAVELDLPGFLDRAEALFQTVPIRGLSSSPAVPHLSFLTASQHLGRLRSLSLGPELAPSQVRAVVMSDQVRELRSLALACNSMGPEAVWALASSPFLDNLTDLQVGATEIAGGELWFSLVSARPLLPRLTRLNLAGNPLGNEGVQLLAEVPSLAQITELNLGGTGFWRSGLAALAQSRHLNGLTRLDLAHNRLSDALGPLAESPHLPRLRHLNLASNGLGLNDTRTLARSPLAPQLTTLSLSSNPLHDDGVAALGKAAFSALKELALDHTGAGSPGLRALIESKTLPSLTTLNLNNNILGPDGAAALGAAPFLGNLRVLKLATNVLRPEGVRALLREGRTGRLAVLDLANNGLGDDGARALAECPALGELAWLDLRYNRITDEGAEALAGSPYLTGLCWLNLCGNWVTERGARTLAESPNLPRLVYANVSDDEVGDGFRRWVLDP